MVLGDFMEPTIGDDFSSVNKYKVDCVEEKSTLLRATHYSEPMGKGKIVLERSPNEVQYAKPTFWFLTKTKKIPYYLIKFVCNNVK